MNRPDVYRCCGASFLHIVAPRAPRACAAASAGCKASLTMRAALDGDQTIFAFHVLRTMPGMLLRTMPGMPKNLRGCLNAESSPLLQNTVRAIKSRPDSCRLPQVGIRPSSPPGPCCQSGPPKECLVGRSPGRTLVESELRNQMSNTLASGPCARTRVVLWLFAGAAAGGAHLHHARWRGVCHRKGAPVRPQQPPSTCNCHQLELLRRRYAFQSSAQHPTPIDRLPICRSLTSTVGCCDLCISLPAVPSFLEGIVLHSSRGV